MSIQVNAYTVGGNARGVVAGPGGLRDILESTGQLALEQVRWQSLDASADAPAGDLTIAIDDVLVAVADDESFLPVHASWHAIRLEVGPYVVEGDMPTLPGFDPDRALTRPSGEFVLLRDVRLGRPGSGTPALIGPHALINRYAVERVEADIMLGFFFPGAAMDVPEVPDTHPRTAATPGPAPDPRPGA